MNPRPKDPKNQGSRTKNLDSAVRKVEAKEQKQDEASGTKGEPVRSAGRRIREGWIEGA